MNKITWSMLVNEQSELKDLLNSAKSIQAKPKGKFCANYTWYQLGYREKIYSLVGWEAPDYLPSFLRSQDAFDIAYNKIYYALPDCNHDGIC